MRARACGRALLPVRAAPALGPCEEPAGKRGGLCWPGGCDARGIVARVFVSDFGEWAA